MKNTLLTFKVDETTGTIEICGLKDSIIRDIYFLMEKSYLKTNAYETIKKGIENELIQKNVATKIIFNDLNSYFQDNLLLFNNLYTFKPSITEKIKNIEDFEDSLMNIQKENIVLQSFIENAYTNNLRFVGIGEYMLNHKDNLNILTTQEKLKLLDNYYKYLNCKELHYTKNNIEYVNYLKENIVEFAEISQSIFDFAKNNEGIADYKPLETYINQVLKELPFENDLQYSLNCILVDKIINNTTEQNIIEENLLFAIN